MDIFLYFSSLPVFMYKKNNVIIILQFSYISFCRGQYKLYKDIDILM